MSDITYDKPFLTYEQMIHLLESRNVIIENKPLAEMALQNFSYYGLVNGYKNTFLQENDSDKFKIGTRFEELYTLHILDTSISNLLFRNILLLEKALKSRISYVIADNYGVFTDINTSYNTQNPNDYLSAQHYSNSNNRRRNILMSLRENLTLNPTHSISIEHYKSTKNHIPPWILTTGITYGLTIEWYRILRSEDKETICNSFINPGLLQIDQAKEFLIKAFELTKEYRNKIAHGNRVFNVTQLPQLPKNQILTLSFGILSEKEFSNKQGQSDLYAILLILMILIDDPYLISHLIVELTHILEPYSNIYFSGKSIYEIFKLPENILERLKRFQHNRFDTT